jgi:hypothetical protein
MGWEGMVGGEDREGVGEGEGEIQLGCLVWGVHLQGLCV